MTCSLQTYRARIGTFQTGYLVKPYSFRAPCTSTPGTPPVTRLAAIYLIILLSSYFLLADTWEQTGWLNSTLQNKSCPVGPSFGTFIPTTVNSLPTLFRNYGHIWDPGIIPATPISITPRLVGKVKAGGNPWARDNYSTLSFGISIFSRLPQAKQNKMAHITNGNRGQRGKGITCLYWNKGPSFLTNKQLDIETIISSHKPHILGLGEANFKHDHDLGDVQQLDYNLHLDSCVENPELGMARVAVYTHSSLRVKRRPDLEDNTTAAVWLECGLPNQRRILVCVGYRQWRLVGQKDSNSASTSEQLVRWLVFLEKWEKALLEDKEVIVTLDANLDFLTWRSEGLPAHHSSVRLKPLVDALFQRILPLGVAQLVTGATRMERGQPKAGLDHLYSNKPEKLSSIQTHFTGMSDHKLLKVTRFSKSFKQNPRFVRKRMFKNFNDDMFREKLSESDLGEILDITDVNEATEILVTKLNNILDHMAPVKTVQTRSRYAPWLGEETKILQKERDAAQEKAAQSDNPDDWRQFRSLRNQVTARLRAEKKEWDRKKLDHTENSSTDIWKSVKGCLGWGGGGPPTQLFSDGKIVSSPSGLASIVNKFFLDKIKRLRESIPAVISDPLSRLREAMKERQCSFSLQPVSVSDVLKIIKGLKNSSATGVDYIDTRTVKLVADLIAPALTHIINLSIRTSTFPNIWKYAKVIPLLKSFQCDPLLPKSYRPVALLPILSKVMEKAVFSQLANYLEQNHIIHPNLHGSRPGHNTSTALIQLYDGWVEAVEEGKMVGVLLCDQSAAFDICDHAILVEKLKLMGVENSAAAWIWSYLSDRQQSCFVDGHLSTAMSLSACGVPQGSIGGPLLWLCFTSDQPDVIHDHPVDGQDLHRGCGQAAQLERASHDKEPEVVQTGDCGTLVGYVDDGAYSYAHSDPVILSEVLSSKYDLLEDWMNSNKLVINADKTHLMVMGGKSAAAKRTDVSIQAGTFSIFPTETEKLLGGQLHQSLQWNHHILDHESSLMKQLTTRINGLKKISVNATFNTRLMVANGAVMSKMVYLITLWGGAQQYLLKALQVQQNTAARTVCGFCSHGWSKKKLLNRVGWLSVRQLIYYHTVIQAHKTIKTGKPRPLFDSISTKHPRNTRSAAIGQIRFGEAFKAQTSFKYRALHWYNSLPPSVRKGSTAVVKKNLKTWVKENVPIDWG